MNPRVAELEEENRKLNEKLIEVNRRAFAPFFFPPFHPWKLRSEHQKAICNLLAPTKTPKQRTNHENNTTKIK